MSLGILSFILRRGGDDPPAILNQGTDVPLATLPLSPGSNASIIVWVSISYRAIQCMVVVSASDKCIRVKTASMWEQ